MTQLFDVIFSDLRASNKNLNRILSLGILFTLAAHFYVVVPFWRYKSQQGLLSEQHRQLETAMQQANSTFERIKHQIEDYPYDFIYQTLPTIKQAILSDSSSHIFQIKLPSGIKEVAMPAQIIGMDSWEKKLRHSVRWYVGTWFTILMRELETVVAAPVSKLMLHFNNGEEVIGDINVGNIVDKEIDSFKEYLKGPGSEILSQYTNEGAEIIEIFQKKVEGAFEPVEEAVSGKLRKTRQAIILIDEKIKILNSRVDSFKSQIGPVPVGLSDFIVLFPMVLVVLVIMFSLAIYKSSHLYVGLWQEVTRDIMDSDINAFQKFADCWYLPPYQNVFQPFLLRLLLAFIAVIFVWASLLIINSPGLFTESDGSKSFCVFMISTIYGIGFLLIVACALYIRKTIDKVNQETLSY